MTKHYVFTQEQLLRALVTGAVRQGVLTEEQAAEFGYSLSTLTLAENGGAVLAFASVEHHDAESAAAAQAKGQSGEGWRPSDSVSIGSSEPDKMAVGVPARDKNDPDPLKVQAALRASMDRAPALPTIRKWDAAQRRKALKWARQPANGPRPDFIVEPAARAPRTSVTADQMLQGPSASEPAAALPKPLPAFDDEPPVERASEPLPASEPSPAPEPEAPVAKKGGRKKADRAAPPGGEAKAAAVNPAPVTPAPRKTAFTDEDEDDGVGSAASFVENLKDDEDDA